MRLAHPNPDQLREEQLQTTHDYLTEQRILVLAAEITPTTLAPTQLGQMRLDRFGPLEICDTLIALDKLEPGKPIKLIIDSGGGSCDEGLSIVDAMESLKSPVYTYCRKAYSMAAIVLACGAKGHRYTYPHANSLIHLPSMRGGGNSKEFKEQSRELDRVRDMLAELLIAHGVDKTKQQILKHMEKNAIMSAAETVEYGLADKIMKKGDL